MVTDTDGYLQLIEYLTEHLSLFESSNEPAVSQNTIIAEIEEEISEQIINLCNQNEDLSFNQRNMVIREIDAIVYDLEEILSGVVNKQVNQSQKDFIHEFAILIKNLFDSEINSL